MMIQGQQLQKDIANTISWSFVIGFKILQTIYRHPRMWGSTEMREQEYLLNNNTVAKVHTSKSATEKQVEFYGFTQQRTCLDLCLTSLLVVNNMIW